MIEEDYLNLITSEFRDQPNYIATVAINVAVPLRVQELLASMVTIFDVDVAVGNQLDIIGQWVGVTRNVSIPISGVFFTWDGAADLGWDFGIWKDPSASTITVLPDENYRILIKAKIAANRWDGTTDGAYRVWDSIFTDVTILIKDNQNMTYELGFVGGIVDSLTQALIQGGYLTLKPEGVRISGYFFPVNTGPLFAWDVQDEFLSGWDSGSWAKEVSPT